LATSNSKEEKQPYYDVTEMTNALVDEKKKAIDLEIISLRPGKRQYSGYKMLESYKVALLRMS
jgi:hypothetical protein